MPKFFTIPNNWLNWSNSVDAIQNASISNIQADVLTEKKAIDELMKNEMSARDAISTLATTTLNLTSSLGALVNTVNALSAQVADLQKQSNQDEASAMYRLDTLSQDFATLTAKVNSSNQTSQDAFATLSRQQTVTSQDVASLSTALVDISKQQDIDVSTLDAQLASISDRHRSAYYKQPNYIHLADGANQIFFEANIDDIFYKSGVFQSPDSSAYLITLGVTCVGNFQSNATLNMFCADADTGAYIFNYPYIFASSVNPVKVAVGNPVGPFMTASFVVSSGFKFKIIQTSVSGSPSSFNTTVCFLRI